MGKVVLVTGCSGFIGFHISKLLLEQKFSVVGIDSLNSYYDIKLKQNRQNLLEKFNSFKVYNSVIEKNDVIEKILFNHKPDVVIHLAAQAGVRHSLNNPGSYMDSNLMATFKLLEASKKNKVKHLLMASSSSVYGSNDKMPFHENQKCDTPLSFYAATKKANENMAHSYSHLYNLPITMFRFFTVYGPWGRPDMALYKFTEKITNGEVIEIYNNGIMERDFTYVSDLVNAVYLLIDKLPSCRQKKKKNNIKKFDSLSNVAPFRVVNIGNSKPIKLIHFIETLEKKLNIKAKMKFLPIQPGDVEKTWSSIELLKHLTNFEPKISIDVGIEKFIDWYMEYNK